MTVTQKVDLTGNLVVTSGVVVGADASTTASTLLPTITSGTGAPSFLAPQGSLFIRTDGSSTSTRVYVNTTGSTTWTSLTSAA